MIHWVYAIVCTACIGTAAYQETRASLPTCAYQWSE